MASVLCTFALSLLSASTNALPSIRHIEVANINKLSFQDKSALFEPSSYLSPNQKTSEHNVHIFDKFGKFIRLNYFSEISGDHIEVFELKPNGLNDIKSVQCMNDNSNTINILFSNKYAALKHAETIKSHIQKHPNNQYFVTGSHDWKCFNKNEQAYTPILRTIESLSIDPSNDKLLVITTEYAIYTDLFKNLDMSLQTNAHMDNHNDEKEPVNKQAVQPESRRKLLLCDDNPTNSAAGLWEDIVDGVEELWKAVETVVSGIKHFAADVEDLYEDATELMDALTTGEYDKDVDATMASWKYNYDGYASESVLDLDAGVTCKNCYAFADLTYEIKITIDDYKLSYFKMVGTGDVKVHIDVESTAEWKDEFSAQTCQISVPELGMLLTLNSLVKNC